MKSSDQVIWDFPEQDPDFQGDPLDPELKNGAIEHHQCTDTFWCILYLVFSGMFVGIAIYAFSEGQPIKAFAPFNTQGLQCGVSSPYENCPYAYVYFLGGDQIFCLDSCPATTYDKLTCGDYIYQDPDVYVTKEFQYICEPTQDQTNINQYANLQKYPGLPYVFNSLTSVWPVCLAVCFITLFIAIIVSEVVKEFAACVLWVASFLFIAFLSSLGGLCYYQSSNYQSDHNWLIGIAIFCWVLSLIAIILFLYFIKKIRISIAILRASIEFIRDVPSVLLVPFFMYAIIFVYFIIWLLSTIYIIACGDPVQQHGTPFPQINLDGSLIALLVLLMFSFYWNCYFATSYVQYVVGSTCADWYFRDMGKNMDNAVLRSAKIGLLNHSGSIAFGGLILTIVKQIQFVFQIFYSCLKSATLANKDSQGCIKCCCGCCSYFLGYFEAYIRFLDQNAFVVMALTGKPFCKSSHDAYYLIKRNSMLADITDGIGELFSIISNSFIGISATFFGFIIVTTVNKYQPISPLYPTLFFIIIALVIASFFMNVYGIAIDTILLCYLIDEEVYKSEGGAKLVPESLATFINEYLSHKNKDNLM